MFCRNGAPGIKKSIESVLNQTYPNIQYVVQDGASTDGTIDILRSYGGRIELVSEQDGGTNDAFWRALLRCRGEYICTCLADEELMPSAIERAIEEFLADPSVGAVTGDAYLWNEHGTIFGTHVGQEFDLLGYLLGDYCPNFSASFFRRSALESVGFFGERWKFDALDTIEFEIWCRLGTEGRVKYVPYIFSKYGIHENQMSQKMPRILGELDSRFMIIEKFLFGEEGFFGTNDALKNFIVRRQYEIIENHLLAYKRDDDAAEIRRRLDYAIEASEAALISAAQQEAQPGLISGSEQEPEPNSTPVLEPMPPAVKTGSDYALDILRKVLPPSMRRAMPIELKLAFERRVQNLIAACTFNASEAAPETDALAEEAQKKPVEDDKALRRRFYDQVAAIYASRGQVDEAWQAWQHAGALDDSRIASTAYQLLAKSPSLSEEQLSARQQSWADRHARPLPWKAGHSFSPPKNGKIKVGYHCSFWATECAKAQAMEFIAAHDRSRIEVVGYSPTAEEPAIAATFDTFKETGMLSDEEFVESLRADGIDVFVELTGLSPHHRFGAMAMRCAPIQITYLNHHASSRVSNVDYILADDIAAPRGCDINYTETIYRLPRCFFSFKYSAAELPPVAPSPHLANGYVTFGCFGGSDKFNERLLSLWARVLGAVPNARLMLQSLGLRSAATRRFIANRMQSFGITPDRLILLPGTDRSGVLRNYALVDISLDTWPYAGGNTIAESVWQGVPVVALQGDRTASAYGASLITGCGLGELVAHSFDEYVDIAASLARDSARLVELRHTLRDLVCENDFGNPTTLARALEDAYSSMLAKRWDYRPIGEWNPAAEIGAGHSPSPPMPLAPEAQPLLDI